MLKGVELPHPGHGHIVLTEPTPVLLYQIATNDTRVLIDVPGQLPHKADLVTHLKEKVFPQMPKYLHQALLDALEDSLRSRSNLILAASPMVRPGGLLLGDSFNMRHPLTGGGMTVALNDVKNICDLLEDVKCMSDRALVEQKIRQFYDIRKPLAATVNILATALYGVFDVGGGRTNMDLRDGCFKYLQKGGWYSEGPVGFLSGLMPSPSFLVTHFFSVAFFSVARFLTPYPTPASILQACRVVVRAVKIVTPLVLDELSFGRYVKRLFSIQ
eukprot:GFYU01033808.1.p1 GENE.GFYU01033808.1~~GFYU01033808.1.p1  ORF type:complete len:272 (+),score=91.65 GFYU01033808.1:402-1217(+)